MKRIRLALVIAAGVVVVIVAATFYSDSIKSLFSLTSGVESPSPSSEYRKPDIRTTTEATTYKVYVDSKPSGASVEFQGINWGKTPMILTLPPDKVVKIRILAQGYKPFEIQQKFSSSGALHAVLKK